MADEWYYTEQGQQQGPVAAASSATGCLRAPVAHRPRLERGHAQLGPRQLHPRPFPRGRALAASGTRGGLPLAHAREPLEDDESRPRRSRRRKQSGLSAGAVAAIVGGIVGGLLRIGGIVLAVVLFSRQGDSRSWSLGKGQKVTYNLRFTGGKKVELWVVSDRDTDVDLFVFNQAGQRVAADEADSKDCYVWFVPPTTQTFRVEVQNRIRLEPFLQFRNGPNSGVLRFKESDQAVGVPVMVQPPPLPFIQPPPLPFVQPPAPVGFRVAPQVIPLQPAPGGVVQQGQLAVTDGRDAVRAGAFCKVYTYPLHARQMVTIDLESNQFDAFLRLEDATGLQLAQDDDGGGGLNARITFVAPRNDTYRIIATTFGPNALGAYTLSIRP